MNKLCMDFKTFFYQNKHLLIILFHELFEIPSSSKYLCVDFSNSLKGLLLGEHGSIPAFKLKQTLLWKDGISCL